MNAEDIAERLMEHPEAKVEMLTNGPIQQINSVWWNTVDEVWEVE